MVKWKNKVNLKNSFVKLPKEKREIMAQHVKGDDISKKALWEFICNGNLLQKTSEGIKQVG